MIASLAHARFITIASRKMNKKNERVKKLWERGVRDLSVLARKIGYNGSANTAGIERVKEALRSLGIDPTKQ